MADGILKVGTITNSAGSGNIAIGSGVTVNVNRPAFSVSISANQTLSNLTETKINFDTEILDTNNCYDSTTNYRFTPTESGEYLIRSTLWVNMGSGELVQGRSYIFKNGVVYTYGYMDFASNPADRFPIITQAIISMNGTTDYVEAYGWLEQASSALLRVDSGTKQSLFEGYKLGA